MSIISECEPKVMPRRESRREYARHHLEILGKISQEQFLQSASLLSAGATTSHLQSVRIIQWELTERGKDKIKHEIQLMGQN